MSLWWDSLSDGELFARLVQRHISRERARYLVAHRDTFDDCRRDIHEALR